ncbi:amp dependent CoA ligase [Cytidiella melzeri]|nr:amp dependent CoA ligase [Cytidiella melzeri]
MTEFCALGEPLPVIPDDLTVPQFMLDAHHPDRPARRQPMPWLIEDATGREIGYKDLRTRTFGLANEFSTRWSIGENDVVCLCSPNHVDWPVVLWAAHRLGAAVAPVNPAYTPEELVHVLTLTGASLLVVSSANLSAAVIAAQTAGIPLERVITIDTPPLYNMTHESVEHLISAGLSSPLSFNERRLRAGEAKTKMAFLCFSSGTTGKPKAVAVSHYAMIANVLQMKAAIMKSPRYEVGDVAHGVLPFFHVFGLVVVLHSQLWFGSTIVVVPKFTFEGFLASIQRYRIKHLQIVPPMVVLLVKHPLTKTYDLSSVRWLMSGAAPLSAELTMQLTKILPQCSIGQGYGMTETFTTISCSKNEDHVAAPGSAGVLIPGIVARVVKPDGSLAKAGESGELVVTGPSMAWGYYKNPEATKETFVNGWVRTGDEVVINEKREVFIKDRIKARAVLLSVACIKADHFHPLQEILKVKGFQVAPAELEGHLLDHPDVADVCVVGVPDDYSGELPLAFVVPSESAQARVRKDPRQGDRLKVMLAKHVADAKVEYKRLAGGVEFVDAIPKNPSGKLLRRVLRDQARAMKAKTPAAPFMARL